MFWRGVAFWRSCLQCFGGAWHFGEAACSVLEGRGKSTVFYMRLPIICSHNQIYNKHNNNKL